MQQYSWPSNALLLDFERNTPNVRVYYLLFVLIHRSTASVLAEASEQFGGERERVKAFNATKLCRCLLMYDV